MVTYEMGGGLASDGVNYRVSVSGLLSVASIGFIVATDATSQARRASLIVSDKDRNKILLATNRDFDTSGSDQFFITTSTEKSLGLTYRWKGANALIHPLIVSTKPVIVGNDFNIDIEVSGTSPTDSIISSWVVMIEQELSFV